MNKLLTNYEQKNRRICHIWSPSFPHMTMYGVGFGDTKNDKRPDTPGLVNSRQNSFFVFFPSSLSPFLPPKNLTKQKFYSKIKQKRKEVKFLYNKKNKTPTPDILSGKNKKGDPMKKAYSLNYDIYSTYDRIDAIAEILDELPQTPNHTDLE